MERRRKIARAQPSLLAIAREHERVKALLQVQAVLHSDATHERDELGAAREKDMLTVIDLMTVDFERRGASAEQATTLEQLDARAAILQLDRRRETGQAGANDPYPLLLSHDLTTTRSFSVFERAARSRKGSAGSRSIFFSSSS